MCNVLKRKQIKFYDFFIQQNFHCKCLEKKIVVAQILLTFFLDMFQKILRIFFYFEILKKKNFQHLFYQHFF